MASTSLPITFYTKNVTIKCVYKVWPINGIMQPNN